MDTLGFFVKPVSFYFDVFPYKDASQPSKIIIITNNHNCYTFPEQNKTFVQNHLSYEISIGVLDVVFF